MLNYHASGKRLAILIIDELSTGLSPHISHMQQVINWARSLNMPIIIVESDTSLNPGGYQVEYQPTNEALRSMANVIFVKAGINAFSTEVVSSAGRIRLSKTGESIEQLHSAMESGGIQPVSKLNRYLEGRGVKALVVMGTSTNLCLQASVVGYCRPFTSQRELAALSLGYEVLSCPQIIRGMIDNETPDWQDLENVSFYTSL